MGNRVVFMLSKPSPNFSSRDTYKPEAIVIHIMAGTLVGTDSWFQSKTSSVSAHYGIGLNGEIHQYVQEDKAAWHAGVVTNPSWKLLKPDINPNKYTIGIEHEGQLDTVWTPEMKKASAGLIADICSRWSIPIDRDHIIGHYQINAVNRPNCPAMNKSIIDELIVLAKGKSPKDKLGEIIKQLQELFNSL